MCIGAGWFSWLSSCSEAYCASNQTRELKVSNCPREAVYSTIPPFTRSIPWMTMIFFPSLNNIHVDTFYQFQERCVLWLAGLIVSIIFGFTICQLVYRDRHEIFQYSTINNGQLVSHNDFSRHRWVLRPAAAVNSNTSLNSNNPYETLRLLSNITLTQHQTPKRWPSSRFLFWKTGVLPRP